MLKIGSLKGIETKLTALVPSIAKKYLNEKFELILEENSGLTAFYGDHEYEGVTQKSREEVLKRADILLLPEPILSKEEVGLLKDGALVIGRFSISEGASATLTLLQDQNVTVIDIDKVPRSSIAQSMDVLSSLASLAGYKAVLSAAGLYSGYFPMMTTAAGTVQPAKVLILGAGVAGLQAIATAKRLGAVVEAFDVRSAVKEEVESLGAKFIEVEGGSEDAAAGGYAIEQSEEYKQLQKQLIHDRAVKSDIIITTANIPGRKAPLLVESETIQSLKPGSVIVDMATASGGNCEGSQDNATVVVKDVTIVGSSKLHEELPKEASRLYSTNMFHLVKFILKDGLEGIPWEHEILEKTCLQKVKLESTVTD